MSAPQPPLWASLSAVASAALWWSFTGPGAPALLQIAGWLAPPLSLLLWAGFLRGPAPARQAPPPTLEELEAARARLAPPNWPKPRSGPGA